VLISLIVLAASFRMPAQGATPASSKEATAVADTMRAMYVAAATDDMTWLESACLERHNGSWKIVFFQSSRVPVPPPSGSR
jgi:hypothetical protein